MKIIGLAGGSGAGKTTAAYMLVDSDPAKFEILNLDDYHKTRDDPSIPTAHGMINWDHPNVIRWGQLMTDLSALAAGETVSINTWSHRSNPEYQKTGVMITRTIAPAEYLILEGYLSLYNLNVNHLYTKSFYLDLDDQTRYARRQKGIFVGKDDYLNKILIPMHKKYVEPTKQNADHVIETSNLSVKQTVDIIVANLD